MCIPVGNGAVTNKLHSLKPVLEIGSPPTSGAGRMIYVLCRDRIGHTHLIHSYILKNDPPPQCKICQGILSVRHILVECNHFTEKRKDIFGGRVVVESFRFHPHSFHFILKSIRIIIRFKLYISYKLFLHSSLHCVYNLVNV